MENIKRLFASLIIYKHNLHTLHWKVTGCHFDCIHELMDNYTKQFDSFIDEVAEIMLICEQNPLSLQGCIMFAEQDTECNYLILTPTENYDAEACFKNIGVMFSGLLDIYNKTCETLPKELSATLDQHMYWLRIENDYKNKRRFC